MIFWIEFKSVTRKTHNVYKAFHSKLSILSIVIVLIRTENTTPDSRGYARPSTLNLSCMMRSYITTVIIISIRSSYWHCVTYRNHMHPPEDVQPPLIRNWAFFLIDSTTFLPDCLCLTVLVCPPDAQSALDMFHGDAFSVRGDLPCKQRDSLGPWG